MTIFTIFTPTYNRSNTLHRVYTSLISQTFRNFEWLIVDDESIDNTNEIVKHWQSDSKTWFPINYYYQFHGHKKKAFNRGVKEAKGELFLTWDSDDEAVPDALEILYKNWMDIPAEEKSKYVGVCALCKDQNGNIIGKKFPNDVFDSDSLEVLHKYHITGEKWGFSRTDILRKFPFPEDVQGYVPESFVWFAIARKYKTRFINQALRIYHQSDDSITKFYKRNTKIGKDYEGTAFYFYEVFKNDFDWFLFNPIWFMKSAASYIRCKLHLHSSSSNKNFKLKKFRVDYYVI